MSKLNQLVSELLEDVSGSLNDDALFGDTDGWDSLKHVQLVVGIQTAYGVDLSADEIAQLTSKRAVRAVLSARGVNA
jgi:acyl carrier protein